MVGDVARLVASPANLTIQLAQIAHPDEHVVVGRHWHLAYIYLPEYGRARRETDSSNTGEAS